MRFRVYYKMIGGGDYSITYNSLEAMQRDIKPMKDSDFNYINACMINPEDKSEEIVFSSYKEIIEAK